MDRGRWCFSVCIFLSAQQVKECFELVAPVDISAYYDCLVHHYGIEFCLILVHLIHIVLCLLLCECKDQILVNVHEFLYQLNFQEFQTINYF